MFAQFLDHNRPDESHVAVEVRWKVRYEEGSFFQAVHVEQRCDVERVVRKVVIFSDGGSSLKNVLKRKRVLGLGLYI